MLVIFTPRRLESEPGAAGEPAVPGAAAGDATVEGFGAAVAAVPGGVGDVPAAPGDPEGAVTTLS